MNLNSREVLVEDLVQYTGLPREEVEARMADVKAVPRQWMEEYGHRPGTPIDYHRFYTFNWRYLFDLANFAGEYRPELANAYQYAKGHCLDFGSGIGTVAVDLAQNKSVACVDAIDICIITQDFLKFRASKHELLKLRVLDPATVVPQRSTEQTIAKIASYGPRYDFVYARDVLEHCINRVEIVKVLCEAVKHGGVIVEATPIQYIGPDDGWENVRENKDYDLWHVLKEKGFEKIESAPTGGMSLGSTQVWMKRG